MDPQRFDRLTRTLARTLRQDACAEPRAQAGPPAQPAPGAVTGPADVNGTCAYPDLPTPTVGRDGQGVWQGICGWEHPPAAPATLDDPRPARTGRSGRRQGAQPLTAREQQIAALIGQGLKDREMAAALVLS
ncbi:MAG: hypothetical protein JOY61_18065, partial [Chloroflexi bacterium]|nr:hypothetical protein [Chloroflexota bacterium]